MREVDRFWGIGPSEAVAPSAAAPAARWATVRLPELVEGDVTLPELRPVGGEPVLVAEGGEVLAGRLPDGSVELAFDPDRAVDALIRRRALTARRPLAARMPFHYHRVPAPVRRLLRDLLTRRQAAAAEEGFPAWPGDASVEAVRRIYLRAREAEPRPFWPDGRRYAIALTHDVDTASGLEVAAQVAAEEAERGLRACWYVVGRDYPLEPEPMAALAAAEVGLHDAHHDNRVAFLPKEAMARRLDACRDEIERYAIRGFRSPSMLRTAPLYEVLRGRFEYDSSIPDSGLLPERNGCATVFPFPFEGMPVLPLTLPPDGQLLGRGLSPPAVVGAWIAKAQWIKSLGGVAVHLTHPEVGFSASPDMRAAGRDFMDWVADEARGEAWHATPAEVVEHWRARA